MQKLIDIINESFACNLNESDDKKPFKELDGWDSMNHMILISQIEQEFNIELSTEDIVSMTCLSETLSIVNNRET